MIKIFSYGTLYESDTQIDLLGRTFDVDPYLDYINGWDIIRVKMYGEYYNVMIPGDSSSVIMGAMVNIPEELIGIVDEYEGEEYKRISIKTMTGNDCQVYVKR